MARDDPVIVQVAGGSELATQLESAPPEALARGDVVVERVPATDEGAAEAPDAGRIVLSVPSPEALIREPENVRRVVDDAPPGAEPLVVVVEAAEELRDDELAVVLDAAHRTRRSVILRVIRDA